MQAVSISQLRSNMKKYLNDVTKSANVLIVSRSVADEAIVILSLKKYNSLNETGHLLSTTANRQRLLAAINQIENGKTREFKL